MIIKNRDREDYSFANINLLGKCNVDCYFCLGKDISEEFSKHNQLNTHFYEWKNFGKFLKLAKEKNIKKIYITGQNTDSLLYKYLEELIDDLQSNGFMVGLRTNGYLALDKMDIINKCDANVGYSVHTLNPERNYDIMGRKDIPNWDKIISATNNCRVSIVVNRYNRYEFGTLVKYLSKFDNIKYIQARGISTDTRYDYLATDIDYYESLYRGVVKYFEQIGTFYNAQLFDIFGKEVCFWRTVETSVNSLNFFSDGTLSDEYFVIEGYLKNKEK